MILINLQSVAVNVNPLPDGGKVLQFTDPDSHITVVAALPPESCDQIANALKGIQIAPAAALGSLKGVQLP